MSSYKHKSRALKRKIQKERLEKVVKGLQRIAKFIKFEEKAEVVPKDQNYDMSVPATTSCDSTTKLKPSGSEVSGSQSTCSSSFVGLVSGASMQVQTVDITEDVACSERQVNTDAEEIVTTDEDSPALGHDDNEYNDNSELGMNYDDNSYACDDPGTWPSKISDSLRQQIVSSCAGFSTFQIRSKSFPNDLPGKNFQETLLYMKRADKQTRSQFPHEWLLWSESKNNIHCLPCSIFKSNVSQLAKGAFFPQQTPYKRLYRYLPQYQNNSEHRKHYLAWKTLVTSLKGHGIDSNLQQMIQCEATKWKAILQRILATTLFLSSRGLAFQGETTQIGDHNGNFFWE
ncbi:hypothetical protein PR048_001681 [Dryococelus australis]|uniref:Uncharacterized protein n=1 Tax=Dryococelus australis TaxID=614101 RepID=A0ABQ9II52_9NEOP|nr:hypothetical protein PR048_001681 [Dryococelus australis]